MYVNIGDYKKALEYANLDLLNNIHNPEKYHRKFDILFKMERFDECSKVLDKLEKEYPTDELTEYKRIQILIANKDYKKAILYLNKYLLVKKDTLYLNDKMYCLFMLGNFDEAIDIGLKILEAEENGLTCFWLSRCYLATKNYQNALIYMNKSILLGNCDKWNYYWKYVILKNLGRNDEANIAYQKAVSLGYSEDD